MSEHISECVSALASASTADKRPAGARQFESRIFFRVKAPRPRRHADPPANYARPADATVNAHE